MEHQSSHLQSERRLGDSSEAWWWAGLGGLSGHAGVRMFVFFFFFSLFLSSDLAESPVQMAGDERGRESVWHKHSP
jgi:hypothetical protein